MVTIALLKSYCLQSVLHTAEATLLSAANIYVFGSCISRALCKIFSACDSSIWIIHEYV